MLQDFFLITLVMLIAFYLLYFHFVKDVSVWFLLRSPVNSLWAEHMDVLLLQWYFLAVISRTESRNRATR